jgi:hypothetical protein
MIVAGDHRVSFSRLSQVARIIDGRKGACQRKNGRGVARCPSCSQNAHAQKVLVRCAQSRAALATPLGGEVGKMTTEDGKDTHVGPVLPERAPWEGPRSTAALGPTWVPFQERGHEQAWREHSYCPMRAVKGSLGHSPEGRHREGSHWLPQ